MEEQELDVKLQTIILAIPERTANMEIDVVMVDPEAKGPIKGEHLKKAHTEMGARDIIDALYDFQKYTPDWHELVDEEPDKEHIFLQLPVTTVYAELVYDTRKGEKSQVLTMADIMDARTFFLECVPDGDDYGGYYVLTEEGKEWLREHK